VAATGVPGHQVSTTKPGFALTNAVYHLHVTNPHPPPPSISLQCRSTRHAQNRATNARFWVRGLNPTPQPRVGEHADPLAPPYYPPAPTTSRHCSTSPFHTARPKSSYKRSVLGFGPHPASPASRWRMRRSPPSPPCHPPAPSTSRHRSTPPFHTARPKSSHKCSVSGFGPNTTPWPRVGERTAPIPAASATSPQHPPSPPPLSFRTAHPKIVPRQAIFGRVPTYPLPLRAHSIPTSRRINPGLPHLK
jgi:hypothetical protein